MTTDPVDRVLNLYLGLPHVAARRCSRLDRQLAHDLLARGLTLDQIEAAMLLAQLRRLGSLNELPPIRSLHYFVPVLDEITESPLSPDWLQYLRRKLGR